MIQAFKMMRWRERFKLLGFLALASLILVSCLSMKWSQLYTGAMLSNPLG